MKFMERLARPLLALALVAAMGLSQTAVAETGQQPKALLTAFVPDGTQTRLFVQFEKFAKEHAFISDIDAVAPDGSMYRVYLRSRDVEIIAVNPFSACTFEITLYEAQSPVPSDDIIGVASDLARALQAVEGVEVVVWDNPTAATPAKPCH